MFSIKIFGSKWEQICGFPRICQPWLKKFLTEIFLLLFTTLVPKSLYSVPILNKIPSLQITFAK